ncbi:MULTISPECIES: AbiV family abortive infection protein [unclassified Rhizobium]|uniref:AbiV family abortive infection protein n=1 Tax=unclassified Rhizobium TaxID=2613769 RepID=UPI000BEA572D|nr:MULTISPECIES: AbiV family abortive infection protein [unclassified Rhizobium]MDF0664360.1 AbiV family abortive infection protein [Rhizobium sp. BC49]PDS76415.1 hypothetical protein CO654_35130 [Rhizobium sp. L18]
MSGAGEPAKKDGRTLTSEDIVYLGGHQAPIFLNAIRLLDDARVLRKQRRYASATALAVLSIEEVGKFVLTHPYFRSEITARRPGGRNAKFSHREKQWAAAQMVQGFMGIHEIGALIHLAGYKLTLVAKDADRKPSPSMVEVISTIEEADVDDFLVANSDFGPHLRFPVHLLQGKYDDVKKKCFYVDADGQGAIISGPDEIDRETCDSAMRTASKAISATKLGLRRHRFTLCKPGVSGSS